MGKNICIIQARRRSSRLPDKILLPLNGFPALKHLLCRLKNVPSLEKVIVAGVDDDYETPIFDIAASCGVDVFRGSEADVLGRFAGAAEGLGADRIVRVTSDCPALDPVLLEHALKLTQELDVDYAVFSAAPHGLDFEIFKESCLREAHEKSQTQMEREHVTPWIARNPAFKRIRLGVLGGLKHRRQHRWVLDYPEDYGHLCWLFEVMDILPDRFPGWEDMLTVAESKPVEQRTNSQKIVEWERQLEKILQQASPPAEGSKIEKLYLLHPGKDSNYSLSEEK